MATIHVAAAARNAMLDALSARLNLGSGPATIKFYTGTQPANADTALSGNTLLGTLTCTDPEAPAASSGTTTFSAITQDSSADATGTATFARIQDSDGNNVIDCDVTATGGGGAITLNTTSIVTGGPIVISSFTISIPA